MDSGIVAAVDARREEAFSIRKENFCDTISFFAPGLKRFSTEEFQQKTPRAFRPISLTGSACALQCEHCQSKILEPMIPLNPREGLFTLAQRLHQQGTTGILISGGSNKTGAVPLQKYYEEIARIKAELGMRVMVHTGLVDRETARQLKAAGVDGVMIDIIGANETIQQVYHLNKTTADYEQSLAYFSEFGLSIRPHIILGLHFGQFLGEYNALDMISRYPVHSLIIVILTPLVGTAMQNVPPPPLPDIETFFYRSRLQLPNTPIMIGCARPLGDHKVAVDYMAVDYGLNGIAYPADGVVTYARQKGLKPKFFEDSCSCGSA